MYIRDPFSRLDIIIVIGKWPIQSVERSFNHLAPEIYLYSMGVDEFVNGVYGQWADFWQGLFWRRF